MTFRQMIGNAFGRVPWLQNELGAKLLGLVGLGADELVDLGRTAVRSSWLLHEDCPDDALPLIGEERGIEKAPAETAAQYRARLHGAWDLWEYAGTPGDGTSFAARALEPFGFDTALVWVRYQASPDWAGDENATNFSRWWALTTDTGPFSLVKCGTDSEASPPVDPPTAGDHLTAGLTASPGMVSAFRRFLRKWKAGHELGVAFIVAPSMQVCGMPGLTADGTINAGSDVVRYWLGQFAGSQYPPTVCGGVHPTIVGASAKCGAILPA